MKIAYVINSVEGGGAALPVPAITQVMRDNGHEVIVLALTRRDGRAIKPMLQSGLTVHVREGGRKDHLAALSWLNREIREQKPDLIWTSLTRATLLGQLVGLRRRIPVVSWQHSARLKPANARLLRLMRGLSRLWIADSTCVEHETERKLGLPADKLTCWPIFRATNDFPVALPWTEAAPVRIGSLGRLHPVKGYDVLCAAIALLRNIEHLPAFEVHIAGEGEERDRLAAMIARDNLPIILDGYNADPRQFLSTLQIYVQPSHWEGLCLAAHEALLCGVPVIASEAGELPHTITQSCGRIVPPNDPEALALALADLLRDPSLLAAMGQTGRERVLSRFDAQSFDRRGSEILARLESTL
ncbi:glycosyltransferase [Asaia lannensis]|uniref:Glycosyltransferase n=1 Tax=Asaia lannensis NBRC 102526 TaxID=1307926 RepID=A0ABT1CJV4_9PROT|nr:glycosyltransferase [Asaia lannensis]MCO6160483.1 glycosyltransferase [Asaia lannensis NBRC 102526]GBQ98085.1 lipopolysaccharide glycosyl transferase [Asaia lannensis NBRC 102526]